MNCARNGQRRKERNVCLTTASYEINQRLTDDVSLRSLSKVLVYNPRLLGTDDAQS